ncbi:Ig-like domain-containing protein [Methanobrevibacter sp. OttesenSCG-928-K11]|nr:Ig-like domain-containing protein [Methanobrevibacter sp. OttesenSCG-928-K11]
MGISAVNANENISELNQNGEDIETNLVSDNINKTDVSIDVNDFNMTYKDGTRLSGYLLDSDKKPIANDSVVINVNNVNYTKDTDNDGYFSMGLTLNPNVYTYTVFYLGSDKYNPSNTSAELTIIGNIFVENLTKFYKNDSQFYTTVLDNEGNPIKNTNVSVNINGVFYNRTTNASGIAKLTINLKPGQYIATAIHPINGLMVSSIVTVISTVSVENLTKFYKNDSQFYTTVIDNEGNPIKNTNVSVNINGVFYNRTTNASGIAKLTINLKPGQYIATAIHPITGLMNSSIVTVKSTLITENLSFERYDPKVFEAQVLDGQGNPLANESVTFNIDGFIKTKLTNDKGIATLGINAYPQEYIITSTYNEYSTSNIVDIFENKSGFKKYNLGANVNGSVNMVQSIGNPDSDVRIAYIIGVHPTENAVHTALFDTLTASKELNYCYDVYRITVYADGDGYYTDDRMKGQLLAQKYIVSKIINEKYDFVIDVHSNEGTVGGNYLETNFAFAPLQDNISIEYSDKIINDNPGLCQYFPESQTSPEYVTLPIAKSGTPTVIYETYKFEPYSLTVDYVNKLITSVDTINYR